MDRENASSGPSRYSPPGCATASADLPHSRSEDSWVDVSSRPSSSSLSSVADEIVTEGLRVHHDSNTLRRRRLRRSLSGAHAGGTRHPSAGGSSQEEYDESESESDRIMTSSNEAFPPSPLRQEWRPAGPQFTLSSASSDNAYTSEDADADENSTAIGRPADHPFTPVANAFSHPPGSRPSATTQQSTNSYFAQRPSRPTPRSSYSARESHSPYSVYSPSNRADHDAALRASLSTLLSCAAAARGLPKPGKEPSQSQARAQPSSQRVDPSTIGFMPESAVFGPTVSAPSRTDSGRTDASDKPKRKTASTAQRSGSKERRAKKVRRTSAAANWAPATMDEVNPTLMTWVVGAGVVAIVSALSFSAGYMTGREAARAEFLEFGADPGSCGKEALGGAGRGLRRLRWTDAASSIRV